MMVRSSSKILSFSSTVKCMVVHTIVRITLAVNEAHASILNEMSQSFGNRLVNSI